MQLWQVWQLQISKVKDCADCTLAQGICAADAILKTHQSCTRSLYCTNAAQVLTAQLNAVVIRPGTHITRCQCNVCSLLSPYAVADGSMHISQQKVEHHIQEPVAEQHSCCWQGEAVMQPSFDIAPLLQLCFHGIPPDTALEARLDSKVHCMLV